MTDKIVSIDVLVREIDHPFTIEEAITAAKHHLSQPSYDPKPVTNENICSREVDGERNNYPVTAETIMVRVEDAGGGSEVSMP